MDLKGVLRRVEDNLQNQPGNIVRKSGEKIVARYSWEMFRPPIARQSPAAK